MSDNSSIEWTEATWNPVTGCTKVSPGCDHCYAERITERFHGKGSFAVVRRSEEKLYLPLKWRKPRRVFVNSMSDLFHDDVPASFIARVFSVMAQTPQHTYQILTKRHGRMRSLLSDPEFPATVNAIANEDVVWPLPNVWGGVSVEDQKWAGIRIDALVDTPLAVRFLSMEPLLGPVDLTSWLADSTFNPAYRVARCGQQSPHERHVMEHGPDQPRNCPGNGGVRHPRIGWVICGGESGPGARPMHPDWARSLRDQCTSAGVPFFMKQWGSWAPVPDGGPDGWRGRRESDHEVRADGYHWPITEPHGADDGTEVVMRRVGGHAGRELDGRTWDEYPERVA